jgi:hypothetical protein
MVHFPGFARTRLWIHRAVRRFYQRGFPHSEISGSKPACGSPKLIAACHVLLRLLLPRHPPCALSSLTTKFTQHTAALSISPHCHPERSISSAEAELMRGRGTLGLTSSELPYTDSISWAYIPLYRCRFQGFTVSRFPDLIIPRSATWKL